MRFGPRCNAPADHDSRSTIEREQLVLALLINRRGGGEYSVAKPGLPGRDGEADRRQDCLSLFLGGH